MKAGRSTVFSFLLVSLLLVADAVRAADTPVAGLFSGISDPGKPTVLTSGTTSLGSLNSQGEGIFDLKNNSGSAITSLLVAVDAGATVGSETRYSCSSLTRLLPTCNTSVSGNTIYLLFSGMPQID